MLLGSSRKTANNGEKKKTDESLPAPAVQARPSRPASRSARARTHSSNQSSKNRFFALQMVGSLATFLAGLAMSAMVLFIASHFSDVIEILDVDFRDHQMAKKGLKLTVVVMIIASISLILLGAIGYIGHQKQSRRMSCVFVSGTAMFSFFFAALGIYGLEWDTVLGPLVETQALGFCDSSLYMTFSSIHNCHEEFESIPESFHADCDERCHRGMETIQQMGGCEVLDTLCHSWVYEDHATCSRDSFNVGHAHIVKRDCCHQSCNRRINCSAWVHDPTSDECYLLADQSLGFGNSTFGNAAEKQHGSVHGGGEEQAKPEQSEEAHTEANTEETTEHHVQHSHTGGSHTSGGERRLQGGHKTFLARSLGSAEADHVTQEHVNIAELTEQHQHVDGEHGEGSQQEQVQSEHREGAQHERGEGDHHDATQHAQTNGEDHESAQHGLIEGVHHDSPQHEQSQSGPGESAQQGQVESEHHDSAQDAQSQSEHHGTAQHEQSEGGHHESTGDSHENAHNEHAEGEHRESTQNAHEGQTRETVEHEPVHSQHGESVQHEQGQGEQVEHAQPEHAGGEHGESTEHRQGEGEHREHAQHEHAGGEHPEGSQHEHAEAEHRERIEGEKFLSETEAPALKCPIQTPTMLNVGAWPFVHGRDGVSCSRKLKPQIIEDSYTIAISLVICSGVTGLMLAVASVFGCIFQHTLVTNWKKDVSRRHIVRKMCCPCHH